MEKKRKLRLPYKTFIPGYIISGKMKIICVVFLCVLVCGTSDRKDFMDMENRPMDIIQKKQESFRHKNINWNLYLSKFEFYYYVDESNMKLMQCENVTACNEGKDKKITACKDVATIGEGAFEITKFSPENSRLYVFQNMKDFDEHYRSTVRKKEIHEATSNYVFFNIQCEEKGYWKVETGNTINEATKQSFENTNYDDISGLLFGSVIIDDSAQNILPLQADAAADINFD